MKPIDWLKEAVSRKDELIDDTQNLLRIKSLLDEENATADAPLGEGVKEALQFMLDLGDKDGFVTKNVGNLAGHLELGEGEEIVGVLCHVDVVPEGDGWTSDPYGAEIRDGKIYARGAIDDKGPTMAAYYAMKIVKELGFPLNKRVRMIIGTDEESEWRCVEHYFKHEEMPTMGFAPDADFPIIYAEKGIADFDLVQKAAQTVEDESRIQVNNFQSGRRYNMVPDFAKASLSVPYDQTEVLQRFTEYLKKNELEGKYYVDNGELILELEGESAHGMEPDKGKNAGLLLAAFLCQLETDAKSQQFFAFVSKYFCKESRGRGLGIAYSDEITGDLTINTGKLFYSHEEGGRLGLNLRYPVTLKMEKTKAILAELLEEEGFVIENFSDSKPHHVEESNFLVQTLKKVYEQQTGEKPELLSIGGGTYARSLKSGVAFGPLFPGRPDCAHQKDEHINIDDLLKATAIYAQAIYELAR
ncbi:dipeptidase PepV [Bacillus canaveralius]|uniref:Dipeptidase PepV n=1 Tax=Bacillus canaveralius TaxID=1403243 RepID=A0A2N5GHD5_9BACI|nr:dipeptidase PepV [Bacillus canaveralius]PLR80173.1 dipeptidase PepV [Bacillus canaveralius]PLR98684.1 dipeptidase PepV [Bacillus canaveralius]RSK48185.1 dipeptidase PepV [Bacillus canaveralius]